MRKEDCEKNYHYLSIRFSNKAYRDLVRAAEHLYYLETKDPAAFVKTRRVGICKSSVIHKALAEYYKRYDICENFIEK